MDVDTVMREVGDAFLDCVVGFLVLSCRQTAGVPAFG